jgi:hypothetical protein
MYKEVTKNPEIVPLLKKSDTSEELHLRLAHFYGLSDLSAATLLPESYRNALAICIYLAAVLQLSSTARFVVLDDVTSSFDAGHQWSLMELIRTKIAYPANPSGPQVIIPLGSNGCRGCSLKQALTVTRENPPFKCGMTSSQTKTIALNRFERARKFIIASLRMATPDGSSRVHSGGMCTKTLFVPNVTKFPLIALLHCTRTKRTIGNTFPDQLAKDFAPHIAALSTGFPLLSVAGLHFHFFSVLSMLSSSPNPGGFTTFMSASAPSAVIFPFTDMVPSNPAFLASLV